MVMSFSYIYNMRTYIILLCAALFISSCKKDKTEPEEPMATELPGSFKGEISGDITKVTEVDSAGQTLTYHHVKYSVMAPKAADLGAPTLNGTKLIRDANSAYPLSYWWPDGLLPVGSPATWVLPKNEYFWATTITDPTTFAGILNFPDTLKLSENFKVTYEHSGWATIYMEQPQGYPINFVSSAYNNDAGEVVLNKISAPPTTFPSRVYVSVTVSRTFSHSNNKAKFNHMIIVGKWVKVVE